MRKTYQGKFIPKNPNKYRGDVTNIVFRSSWELKVMNEFDRNPAIIEYASEEIVIPYISPKDGRVHRYYPDFWVRMKDIRGHVKTFLMEVKPAAQCAPPKKPKRITARFINEAVTYEVNQAKWAAARRLCKEAGWEFRVTTEHDIFVGKK